MYEEGDSCDTAICISDVDEYDDEHLVDDPSNMVVDLTTEAAYNTLGDIQEQACAYKTNDKGRGKDMIIGSNHDHDDDGDDNHDDIDTDTDKDQADVGNDDDDDDDDDEHQHHETWSFCSSPMATPHTLHPAMCVA